MFIELRPTFIECKPNKFISEEQLSKTHQSFICVQSEMKSNFLELFFISFLSQEIETKKLRRKLAIACAKVTTIKLNIKTVQKLGISLHFDFA